MSASIWDPGTVTETIGEAEAAKVSAEAAAAAALAAQAAAEAASANLPNAVTAGPDKVLVSNPTGTSWLYKTAAQLISFLGLGTAATKNTGTAVGNVVEVITGGKLPVLDGSNLTNTLPPITLSTAYKRSVFLRGDKAWAAVPNSDIAETTVSGRYYGPQNMNRVVAGFTSTQYSGKMYLVPIFIPNAVMINYLCCQVSTLIAAKSIRLGLYKIGSDGIMGDLVFEATTQASFATVGVKELDVSDVVGDGVAAGWYYLAFLTDATVTGICDSMVAQDATSAYSAFGSTAPGSPVVGYTKTQSYGPMPTSIATGDLTPVTGSGVLPALYYKPL